MAGAPVAKLRNSLLAPDAPVPSLDAKPSALNHRRSICTASAKASLITLVENDSDLDASNASKLDDEDMNYPSYHSSECTWADHLLGVFCIKRTGSSTKKMIFTPKTSGWFQHSNTSSEWPSPWILPVYVISKSVDEHKHKHTDTKIAKCTIDTGNMQGNIVSRNFAETLGYSETSFRKLTDEELKGGTGITGDELIPLGAVYLTWYHQNSTRVFRDMRFLVSPTARFDLIIGARSIQKDHILDVPCLIADPKDISFVPQSHPGCKAETQLDKLMADAKGAWVNKKEALTKLKIKNPQADTTTCEEAMRERKEVEKFYILVNDIFRLYQANDKNKTKLSDSQEQSKADYLRSLKTLADKYKGTPIENELRAGLKDDIWNNFWATLEKMK